MNEAVFGFVGVILGFIISIFGSWLLAHCKLKKDARYLASRAPIIWARIYLGVEVDSLP